MEKLNIKGGEFVKAKVIAREFGYTPDYVGQLCRSGKVDGQLVGRTWYISRQSLTDHKEGRYKRQSTPKAEKAVIEKPKFYNRAENKPVAITTTYDGDDSELIPQVEKTTSEDTAVSTRLDVRLADAKELKVRNKSREYDFSPGEKYEAKFTGKIAVTSEPEIDFDEPDVFSEGHSKSTINNKRNSNKNKAKTFEPKLKSDTHTHKIEVHEGGGFAARVQVDTQKKDRDHTHQRSKLAIERIPESATQTSQARVHRDIHVTDEDTEEPPQSVHVSYVLSSAVAALFISFIFLGTTQQITVTDQVSFSEYVFSFGDAIAAVYGSK